MNGLRATLKSHRKFSLNWTYLDAITNGVSAIDLGALALRNLHDARQFAREYGYDLDRPGVADYLRDIQREAVDFIRETFLDPAQHARLPDEVANPDDPLRLLVLASQHVGGFDPRRLWACAVLKVMHGLFYIDSNLKLRHFATIRQQVFASLDEVIRSDGEQEYLTDGELCLPLLHVDRKRNKGRHSILLKLLQKAAYVASDIHDHLGVRLTLATRFECLLALDILRRAHVISVTNIEGSRTRNTLLDLAAAKQVFARYRSLIDRSDEYPRELLQRMDAELEALAAPQARADNPHSGAGFSSLQLTVRKMIHLDAGEADAMAGPTRDGGDASFFFEYEIQLMDAASFDRSQHGPASHVAYKQRQVDTARKRVFGPDLLRWIQSEASAAVSTVEA